jgi:hypothetical protein
MECVEDTFLLEPPHIRLCAQAIIGQHFLEMRTLLFEHVRHARDLKASRSFLLCLWIWSLWRLLSSNGALILLGSFHRVPVQDIHGY